MPFTLTLPKLSPTMEEGTIAKWRKKEGDFVKAGEGVLYLSTLLSGLTKSGFTKLAAKSVYKAITIRNHNTAQKLIALMEA